LNTATLPVPDADDFGPFPGDPALGWAARLRTALARAGSADDLLLVAPGVEVDAATLAQMRAALAGEDAPEAVSPLASDAVRRAWRLDAGADAALEAWTWSPHIVERAPADPRCALWRRGAAERVAAGGSADTARLPYLAVDLPAIDGEAAPSSDFRPGALAFGCPAPTAAGRDGRPVILHVLHDWGGGVERFVADQMRDDAEAIHLALVSHGTITGGLGQRLALYVDLGRCPIRTWACEPPVGDVADGHPTVREALDETLRSFGVGALRVSSLIGTTLDVLRTGLPTALVLHDAYPFWPLLDDESPQPRWDDAAIARAAAEPGWRFAERDPVVWRARTDAATRALLDARAIVVAPSQAILDRLAPFLPEALRRSARRVPHGVPAGARGSPQRGGGPLRVLVPGRLVGGKGERLLDALLPIAPAGIAWCFAGGCEIAQRYAAQTGGVAIDDYTHGELGGIVAGFDPDLALLPSLLPESFGYVLSEMQALGVPLLAADVGAYGERIDATWNGLGPVEGSGPAVAAAFATALAACVAEPGQLRRALPAPPDPETARKAWRELQVPLPPRPRPIAAAAADVATLKHARGTLGASVEHLRRERDQAYLAHGRDTEDLVRQRDVAVDRIAMLMQEQARERAHIAELRESIGALDAAAAQARAELRELVSARDEAMAERDEAYGFYERDTSDLIRQRDTALSQRDATQHQLADLQRTLRHPLLRWPFAAVRRGTDAAIALRYHLGRTARLLERGLRSLRQRGLGPTLAAARRRFLSSQVRAAQVAPPAEAPLAFAAPTTVRASVVIPVYGKLDFTVACLRSLANSGLPGDVEVIVVDDASPDDSARELPRIAGLRYHRNASNLGFVGSCNAGAALARGAFLVFLNNDTTLTPGWLDALLGTFGSHPDTGLAGAQLVYPDGRLQESGGIVFADGSGWNYGRFEDPRHPAYTFVREADYCSGAAIAIRRELFERLGGFDERYAPAYYEDTDLAMKVREAGLKVRVQPGSVVVHHEGVTAGTDTGSGVKAYQVRNQQRFLERWRDVLARRHPAPSQAPHYAAQHRARARVLVVDATTPMPDRDSGSVRLFELLRLLVEEGCAVSFLPENGLDDGRYTQALRALGVEAWAQPWLGAIPEWLAKHGPRFQLIVVSRHYVLSPLLPLLRRHAPQASIVFDTVDLHHLREQREAAERGDEAMARAAQRTRADELALIAAVDRTWVVSPVEKALLAEALPKAAVDVVSNIHRVRGAGPAMRERSGLLFVGGFRHPPNVDAALWLADSILPRIRERRPDITLSLVGSEAPAAVLALDGRDGIRVLGHVPDLEPLLDSHRYSVAPLRYGAGVKGKVNQALAHGLPVVATRCAVEGMGLEHGVDALVADDAEAFATALLSAYDDELLWNRLVEGGLANTEREFSPERARQTLRAVFASLR
jgi:GT2 family glycosyltransferase